MVPDESDPDTPSIAPPRLGLSLRRRKKAGRTPDSPAAVEPSTVAEPEPDPSPEPSPEQPEREVARRVEPEQPQTAAAPVPAAAAAPSRFTTIFDAVGPARAVPAAAAPVVPAVSPEAVPEAAPESIQAPQPVVVPDPEPVVRPEPVLEPEPVVEVETGSEADDLPTQVVPLPPAAELTDPPEPEDVPEAPLPADVAPDTAPVDLVPGLEPDPDPPTWTQPVVTTDAPAAAQPEPAATTSPGLRSRLGDRLAERRHRPARTPDASTTARPETVEVDRPSPLPSLPSWLHGRTAAMVTGLAVGLLLVLATSLILRGCDLVRGTASCGSGPGFFLLVAVLILAGLLGTSLLRATRVPEPGSTSVLAVGLTAVVALLFLSDQLLEWWMVIAIPVVSVGTFALSHWVTTAFSDTDDDHDGQAGRGLGSPVVDADGRVS